jgi:hypothetical protein
VARAAWDVLGPDTHPTACFAYGGQNRALLAELVKLDFDVLTCRKDRLAPNGRHRGQPFGSSATTASQGAPDASHLGTGRTNPDRA